MEPVVLDTGTDVMNRTEELLDLGATRFKHVWGASSFKCSQQPNANYVHMWQTINNHLMWGQYIRQVRMFAFCMSGKLGDASDCIKNSRCMKSV